MYLNLIQSRFKGALCALKSYFEIIVFATEISTPALNTTINDSDEADDRNQVEPAPENEKYLETDSNCVSEANVDHLVVDDVEVEDTNSVDVFLLPPSSVSPVVAGGWKRNKTIFCFPVSRSQSLRQRCLNGTRRRNNCFNFLNGFCFTLSSSQSKMYLHCLQLVETKFVN